jgi:U3 small nucleolar RNA-associated protein 25
MCNVTQQVLNRRRFESEFGHPDGDAPNPLKPTDFNHTFAGNVDDCFRIGVSLSKRSVKLYADFYNCDST